MKIVMMYHQRFVDRVKSGQKCHTIRKVRQGRPIQVGDELSHRCWESKPYRSKQITLREEVCSNITVIDITTDGSIYYDGQKLDPGEADILAEQDGFATLDEMLNWHREQGGLPFEGVLIEWKLRDQTSL